MARPLVVATFDSVNRNPRKLASAFRFVPGMRIVGPMVLAQSQIKPGIFVAHALVSAAIWAATYTIFGIAIGEFLARVLGRLSKAEHLVIVAAVVTVIATALAIRHIKRTTRD